MNILLYFENQINPMRGGTERVADTIAHAMRERGHNIYYLSRRHVEGEYDIDCYFLPDEIGNSQLNIDYINSLITQHNIDIVINEGANTDDVYLFSTENIKNAKVVSHLHFAPYGSFKYYYKAIQMPVFCKNGFINLLKWMKTPYNKHYHFKNTRKRYKYMIEHSDKVITLAPTYIKDLLEIAGIEKSNNIISIFNPTSFSDVRVDLSKKDNTVLYVGRLDFSPKRIDLLLDIWDKASKCMPEWKLQILGSGPDEDRLKSIVTRKSIENVEFLGFQKPNYYYKRAKVICMTSLFEGTPMVITEAMQYGCVPIVYDTFSAINDMIENEINGYIIKPFNKRMYIKKLVSLTDEEKYLKNSKSAKDSLNKFNNDAIIERWITLFENLK